MAKMTPHPCSQEAKFVLLQENFVNMKENFAELKHDLGNVNQKLDQLKIDMENTYAKKASVDKLWTIVWSVIGFFFVGAGSAILSLILIKH